MDTPTLYTPHGGIQIDRMLSPRSVAVVGASPDATKPGGRCLAFLHEYGYLGRILPINPKYTHINGLRCYPDIGKLPEQPDLVILAVPSSAAVASLEQAGLAGARAAIIFSSGFAEAGEAGAAQQRRLQEVAKKHSIAVLGPNCLGLVELRSGLVASFSTALAGQLQFTPAPIAFVSQSGAMGIAVFTLAQREGVGIGAFVSTGNEAVLDLTDFIRHFTCDPQTDLVLGYAEGIRDGRRFVQTARAARRAGKSIALLKVGRSDAGGRAARSHTGALAGSVQVYEAAFRRGGIITADGVQDLIDIAAVSPGTRHVTGRTVGIVSMSGGAGVMMADACSLRQLEVAVLGNTAREELGRLLPDFANCDNPVDVGSIYGNLNSVIGCIRAIALDPGVAQVLVFIGMSPHLLGSVEPALSAVQKEVGKPVIVAWLAGPLQCVRSLRAAGIAAYDDPLRAVRAAAALADAVTPLPGPEVELVEESGGPRGNDTRQALAGYLRDGRSTLTEREVKTLLANYGIPVVEELFAASANEAAEAGRRIGREMAVKAEAPDLLHKTDAGAVKLRVAVQNAAAAYEVVTTAAARVVGVTGVRGALLQPMVEQGLEILIGLRHDPQFGPTITVGMGGVASEVLADATTELVPIDRETAHAMLARLRSAPLLGPFRGAAARDSEALVSALVALSQLAVDAGPLLSELDVNPIIVHEAGRGCTAVDGAAILSSTTSENHE